MNLKAIACSLFLLAQCASALAYSIWPVPRSIATTDDEFPLSGQLTLVADNGVDSRTIQRAKEVLDRAGIAYTEASEANPDGGNLMIGINGTDGQSIEYATEHNVPLTVFSTEGYCFDPHVVFVDNSNILVVGDSEGSSFYAFATLEQMLEQAEGNALQGALVQDYAHAKYRGLVEGYYGYPWSMESRLNLFDYMKRYKMNYFVYGPKADPYHAGNWRVNYPETVTDDERAKGLITTADIQTLAAHAAQCNVDFVWAVHPTLGSYSINLSWVDDIMTKFEQLYSLGVRHFGVSVDDMSGHPSNQSQLPHLVQQAIDAKWNTDDTPAEDHVGNVLFVPTCYALNYNATYSLTLIKDISPKVEVAFTGYDCFSNIRASSFAQMASYIGRDPIFWWNNPVNDDHDNWLYMHGLTERWTIEQQGPVDHMRGLILNPMCQGQVSKICIFSAADYSWNPDGFNEDSSWEQSLKSIVKTNGNVEALKNFIRVMSAYTTTETNTPEGEELKELYQDFQNSFSATSIPEATELTDAMQKCLDACAIIRTFKDSEDDDQRLFYLDLEPWLNKVEDMARIVTRGIEFMRGESSLDHWAEFAEIMDAATNLHTNHTMPVLEGSGTSTYVNYMEVQPTPVYLDPFIDFLATKLPDYAPALPARDKSPKVITNLSALSGVELESDDARRAINGLSGVELGLGEYVGVFLNRIEDITITSPALPDGVVLEYSISGKEWEKWEGEETPMAYFRLRGNTEEIVPINFDRIEYTAPVTGVVTQPTANTNMGVWQTYTVNNVVDGDETTFFWSNAAQSTGDYILLDFGSEAPRGNVTLLFNSGDKPSGTALVQVSNDASQWTTVATFSKSDIVNNTYECSANGISARYVRLYLDTVTDGSWFQLAEFTVETLGNAPLAVAYDAENNPISELNDISLTSHYKGEGEGFVEYQFIENLDIEEIHIYHNSHFTEANTLPTIKLLSNGEWIEAGVLDAERTIVPVDKSQRHVTKLRISWTDGNAPDLYEVYPVGPEYVQPADEYTGIEAIEAGAANGVKFRMANNTVTIEAATVIVSVELTDAAGRQLAGATPASTRAALPCTAPIAIATVHLADGTTLTRKLAASH